LDFEQRQRVDPRVEAVEIFGKARQIVLDGGGKMR
jgi:hypothetical protein